MTTPRHHRWSRGRHCLLLRQLLYNMLSQNDSKESQTTYGIGCQFLKPLFAPSSYPTLYLSKNNLSSGSVGMRPPFDRAYVAKSSYAVKQGQCCATAIGTGPYSVRTFTWPSSSTQLPGMSTAPFCARQNVRNCPFVIGRHSTRKAPTCTERTGLSLSHPKTCSGTSDKLILSSYDSASSWPSMSVDGPSVTVGVVGGRIASHCAARCVQGGIANPGGGSIPLPAR
jgi:hypothetical protein